MEAQQLTCPPGLEGLRDPSHPEASTGTFTALETAVTPETMATPKATVTPETTVSVETRVTPEAAAIPEATETPDATATPVAIASQETTANPEAAANLEATANQETTVTPTAAVTAEATVTLEIPGSPSASSGSVDAAVPLEALCAEGSGPQAESATRGNEARVVEPGGLEEEAEPHTVQELLQQPVNKKKFAKMLAQLMDSLSDFPSAEEKLAALCSKYTEMSLQARSAHQLVASASRERELLRTENHRLLLVKGKLETLCRELQRNNKQLLDESLDRVHSEEKKRREMTDHFQATLDNIRKQMELNEDRSERLRGENQQLAERLSTLLHDYAHREEQVAKILKYRELQQQLSSVKLQEEEELRRDGEQRHERDKEFLLQQAAEGKMVLKVMEEKEEALKRQLLFYTKRISEFQEMLTKSNKSFSSFRGEMEQMTKKITKLEKEALVWKERWQQSSRVLLDMTEEKVVRDKEMECLQLKLQRLERLCRALQTERGDLTLCVKRLTSQTHGGDAHGDGADQGPVAASDDPRVGDDAPTGEAAREPGGPASGELADADVGAYDLANSASSHLVQLSRELAELKFAVCDATGSSAGKMPSAGCAPAGPHSLPDVIGEERRGACGDAGLPLASSARPPAPGPAEELDETGESFNANATGQILTSLHFPNTDPADTRRDRNVGRVDSDTANTELDNQVGGNELDVGRNSDGVDCVADNVALTVGKVEGKLPVEQLEPDVSAARTSTFDCLQASCRKLEESFSLVSAMCEQSQEFLNTRKQNASAGLEDVVNGTSTETAPRLNVGQETLEASPTKGDVILPSDQQDTPELSSTGNSSSGVKAAGAVSSPVADHLNSPSEQDMSSSASP